MPRISAFYGILIYMYYQDHSPPHFHALYAEHEAIVDIVTGVVTTGALPRKATELVAEWAVAHRAELLANWNVQGLVNHCNLSRRWTRISNADDLANPRIRDR